MRALITVTAPQRPTFVVPLVVGAGVPRVSGSIITASVLFRRRNSADCPGLAAAGGGRPYMQHLSGGAADQLASAGSLASPAQATAKRTHMGRASQGGRLAT